MDPIQILLGQLGINLVSQSIYDVVKSRLTKGRRSSRQDLAQSLHDSFPYMSLDHATVIAATVVDFFAEHGIIEIKDSDVYAKDSVWMRSAPGTAFSFRDGSTSKTAKTEIIAGKGTSIVGQGGAQIRQNPDGSISFHT